MRSKFSKTTYSVGFGLALAFIFGCSSDDNPSNNNQPNISSGSEISSSSGGEQCESVFNPANKFCYDGNVYDKCDGMPYNPSSQICENGVAAPAKCGGVGYNPLTQGCCDNAIYSKSTQQCVNEASVMTKCGNGLYSQATQFCSGGGIYPKCDGEEYDVSTQQCCGNVTFSFSTHQCVWDGELVVYDKCDGQAYAPSTQFCQSGTNEVKYLCGTETYASTQDCCNNSTIFSKTTERCTSGVAEAKCENIWYGIATKFCYNGVVYDKCDGTVYSPTSQICENGVATPAKCGNESYDPLTQYCGNGTVKNYDTPLTDARDGTKYKTTIIGTQTWMAENLNYNAADSKCYNNDEANCTIYGRLYDWATAKTVCPSGWHLSSEAEWIVLMKLINPSCGNVDCAGAGTKLKASRGWNDSGNGTDDYGFTALPGGSRSINDSYSYYDGGGSRGYWWTNNGSSTKTFRRMVYNSEDVFQNGNYSNDLYSVRCVMD